MMTKNDVFYKDIMICSNKFHNVRRPLVVDDREPFFIRRGLVPLIWINAAITPQKWLLVVDKNVSLKRELSVAIDAQNASVSIIFLGLEILSCRYDSQNGLYIGKLNLKVLGFDILGRNAELIVGKHRISNYEFKDTDDGFVFDTSQLAEPHHTISR